MSKVLVPPNQFKQIKELEQRISKLERIASTTTLKDVNTTGLTSAQIDAAVFAGTSTPSVGAQAADGLIIRDSANNLLLVRQGGVWEPYVYSSWNSFTPVVTPNSGSLTSYTATGTYQKVNSLLSAFQFNVSLTNIGTASSDMHVALPSNFSASALSDCIVRETAVTGALAFCYISGSGHTLDIYSTYLTSSTSIWSNGYNWAGLIFIPGTWS